MHFCLVQFLPEHKAKEIREAMPKKVGEQVRLFRKQKRLTQTELAHKAGMDRQYIYKIEKGKITPNLGTIAIIAYALEIHIAELFLEIEI